MLTGISFQKDWRRYHQRCHCRHIAWFDQEDLDFLHQWRSARTSGLRESGGHILSCCQSQPECASKYGLGSGWLRNASWKLCLDVWCGNGGRQLYRMAGVKCRAEVDDKVCKNEYYSGEFIMNSATKLHLADILPQYLFIISHLIPCKSEIGGYIHWAFK